MPQLHTGRWDFLANTMAKVSGSSEERGGVLTSIFGVTGADWQVVLGRVSAKIAL